MDITKLTEQGKKAMQFWETHFPEYIDKRIDEQLAQNINFWEKLQTSLESETVEIVDAVIFSSVSINIASTDMYIKIVRIAKRVWDKKIQFLEPSDK